MKKIITYLVLVALYFSFLMTTCDEPMADDWNLVRVELDNLNNAGKEIIVAETSLPKEVYVIGVKCYVKLLDGLEDLIWIDDTSQNGVRFLDVEDEIHIVCDDDFNEKYLKGSDVTALFTKSGKELVKQGRYACFFILNEAPNPGMHSFKVVYTLKDNKGTIEGYTKPIEFL